MTGFLTDSLPQIIVALFTGGGVAAVLTAFWGRWKQRADGDKTRAEAELTQVDAGKEVVAAAVGLLEPLREQVAYLKTELAAARQEHAQSRRESEQLRREVHELRDYIAQLVQAIQAGTGAVPPWPAHMRDGGRRDADADVAG